MAQQVFTSTYYHFLSTPLLKAPNKSKAKNSTGSNSVVNTGDGQEIDDIMGTTEQTSGEDITLLSTFTSDLATVNVIPSTPNEINGYPLIIEEFLRD